MKTIMIKEIITHNNPDLDGMLSILLLKKFGEVHFPGVSSAIVTFHSASKLPHNMSPSMLEKQGILAVDIGGGRFDSHPGEDFSTEKINRSAADLIAEKLGMLTDLNWSPLIEYTRMHDTNPYNPFSKALVHQIFSLNTVIEGFTILHENDSMPILNMGIETISVIPSFIENVNAVQHVHSIRRILDDYYLSRNINSKLETEDSTHFLEWYDLLKTDPSRTYGEHPLERVVALSSLLHGAYYYYEGDNDLLRDFVFQTMDAILVRENYWFDAISQYKTKSIVKRIDKLVISSISSDNGLVIKAARFVDNPDILVYQAPNNLAITILIKRKGKLHSYPFENIVARIRLLEALETNISVNFSNLTSIGSYYGWFFHQSRNLIIRGSRKDNSFIPTSIPFLSILDAIYMEFDIENSIEMSTKFRKSWIEFSNPRFKIMK